MKKLLIPVLFLLIKIDIGAQTKNEIADTTKPPQNLPFDLSKNQADSNVLIVVNGIVAGTIREIKRDINFLFPPDIIQSINILKGTTAIDKYGEKGKAGVIEFILKDVKIKELKLSEVRRPEDSIYENVEIEASFKGGEKVWLSYLMKNLKPEVPSDNHAPPGAYTVVVGFVVDKNGELSDVKPLTSHGFGMEEEVVRIMSKGPSWEPAINNGRNVKSYRKQPVTFINLLPFELTTYTIMVGKSNDIEIKVDDTKDEDFEASVSEGTIIRKAGSKFIITVDKPGRILLTVTKKEKKKTLELGTVALEVK
jgi:Gram-negative bacterial TonB protein C-terminal